MSWLKPKARPLKKVPPQSKVVFDPTKSKIATKNERSANVKTDRSSLIAEVTKKAALSLVTDSSEGSSIVSYRNMQVVSSANHNKKHQTGSSVPAAIVTKKSNGVVQELKEKRKIKRKNAEMKQDEWNSDTESEPESESDSSDSEDSQSETDADQALDRVLNPKSPKPKISLSSSKLEELSKLIATKSESSNLLERDLSLSDIKEIDLNGDESKLHTALHILKRKKKKQEKLEALSSMIRERQEFDHEKARAEIEEERRKREEGKPLTSKEIRAILRDDDTSGFDQNNWVRRSRRQPNRALLNSKPVRILIDKLKMNDLDMRVLKMKKYINDPDAPCALLDAALDAMEDNTNCEALYIQNFNEGMRDQQVLHLLRILQQPSCNIWCLNIGENYNVSDATWEKFTKGLIHTKITHMYASEHTITSDMKDEIRFTIRENRKKHDMHINPNNLDVIVQCTHCWWNPINAKVLRPYLKKKGYEHVLKDKEAQGLQGSHSAAPTV